MTTTSTDSAVEQYDGRPMTFSEYLTLPEVLLIGGAECRGQLTDGHLQVTESAFRHDEAIFRLRVALRLVLPADLTVSHLNWHIDEHWAPVPDVIVPPKRDHGLWYRGVPALAVEVLAPTTRHVDLGVKARRYAEAGLPFYWLVDLDVPTVWALQLVDDAWVEVARTTGGEPATLPFEGGTLSLAAASLLL